MTNSRRAWTPEQPCVVDETLVPLLEMHGMTPRAARLLVRDARDDVHALRRIDAILPVDLATGHLDADGMREIAFSWRPTREVSWNGHWLLIRRRFPDTVVAAMAGRRLGEILEHPGLPGSRIVTAALSDEQGVRVHTTGVMREVQPSKGATATLRRTARSLGDRFAACDSERRGWNVIVTLVVAALAGAVTPLLGMRLGDWRAVVAIAAIVVVTAVAAAVRFAFDVRPGELMALHETRRRETLARRTGANAT